MKQQKLELYYFPQCPYCQVVLSAIRVAGLDNEVILYDIIDEPHRREKLQKDTGRSTVPCLYIDGKPMFESRDIAKYLHEYARREQTETGDELSGN